MDTVNLYDAKTNLSNLVERAARGEEIVIAKAGCPLARLVPLDRRTTPRPLELLAGQVSIGEEVGDPLPDDIRLAFEGNARSTFCSIPMLLSGLWQCPSAWMPINGASWQRQRIKLR